MLKYRPYFDKDKASAWINKMADDGWALRRFGGGFWSFEPCAPGTYRYAVDFGALTAEARQEYQSFMESVGLTPVGHWGPWVVLRQPAAEGPIELYTDAASTITQRQKILTFFKIICIIELLCFCILCMAVPESGWAWWTVLATALAGACMLIFANRCFQLQDDILALRDGSGASGAALSARRRSLTFIATGLGATLAGLLLGLRPDQDFASGFLIGFGVILEGFGVLTMIWNGQRLGK